MHRAGGRAAVFRETGQKFAETVTFAVSKATIALGADGLDARLALAAQGRETVTRIPMAPLFIFVLVNLFLSCVGLSSQCPP